ncbi:alpha-glucuronidase [Flavobacteriaceae bacterium XHP0103]|uniref:alpha-glucuronidase n=1 Tax=Marixanthotalea marina TaxID=2844359 RepID=UPI002989C738|nr:alpha-glucuronidase [Marixanthotalea marina]MBU3821410.1 alpha-glucuronidase [Marixanthotalea marina]
MNHLKLSTSLFFLLFSLLILNAQNGHNVWLQNKKAKTVNVVSSKESPTLNIAKNELNQGWLGTDGATITLTVKRNKSLKQDGFILNENGITANTDLGILYGTFELLRRQQTGESTSNALSIPSYDQRILNHWDNPNGSIERGYAGNSLFWRYGKDSLTVTDSDIKLWQEYARINASVGINGSVLNNVNASPMILTSGYLQRVKAINDVLRPYGIKTFLSIKFSSPSLIGGLETSDPLDKNVIKWWRDKVKEIYTLIPDFGGFLVKASSEGQPGPQDYGRSHADGANMLADALKPYNGIVMWRAFVYSPTDEDRAKQAYTEFAPLDGEFRDNVIIQVKNGPIDFQPREPFSPLFGALKETAIMPELQITQEYLGHSTHLAYLAPMWKEFLESDTYQEGEGSTVAKTTDGSLFDQKLTAIAGVANTGLDDNWTGHTFAQSNWYAFGRLAWNHELTSEQIADEWLKLTFGPFSLENKNYDVDFDEQAWNTNFLNPVKQMMLDSREAIVDYMMPLGLHHIFSPNAHYGPGPWYGPARARKDWTSLYYHQADSLGIGFDRTPTGSNATIQYEEPLRSQFNNIETCPEDVLLWFHHVPWDYKMKSGKTLWEELCYHYDTGVHKVRTFQTIWDKAKPYVDHERFYEVQTKLRRQARNAIVWKDACLLYFQEFSNTPIPYDIERPLHNLEDLKISTMKRPLDYNN